MNLHENAREAVAPDTAQASRSFRASKLMRASRVSRSVRASKLSRASTPKRSRDRNKRQRRGNPRRNTKISSGRSSRHAVLHRQARRFGHRSERCASTSCAPTTDRGVRRQHRQPRGFTPVFGEIPLQNRRKGGQEGVRSASAYPTYRGIGKESVRASRNASGNGLQFHA